MVNPIFWWRRLPLWGRVVLFGLVYFLSAQLGQQLAFPGSPTVTFWLPGGFYVATLLLSSPRTWPLYILAALCANFSFDLLQGRLWYASLLFFTGNSLEALTGAWLVRRFIGLPQTLKSPLQVAGLGFFAALFSPMLSATLGAAVVSTLFGGSSYTTTWLAWWSGDALGVLVLAPFVFTWMDPVVGRQPPARRLEALLLLAGLGLTLGFIFFMPFSALVSRAYIVVPLLVWAALRFPLRMTTSINLGLALLSAWGTRLGLGAFATPGLSGAEQVTSLQIFLSVMILTALLLASIWHERQAIETGLRDSETRLKKAQRVAHVGSWVWHILDNRLEWSDEMYRIFGVEKERFSASLADIMASAIHPDDQPAVEQANRSVIEAQKPIPLEYRVVWPDGTVRTVWAEAGELVEDQAGHPISLSGIVQDISERKQSELEILRLNRLYHALSQVNECITRVQNRSELLSGVCRILVQDGELAMACMGWQDSPDQAMVPVAHYFQGVETTGKSGPAGHKPCTDDFPGGQVVQEGYPLVWNNLTQDPPTTAWHTAALAQGFASCAALPVRDSGSAAGVLAVFATEANYFRGEEIRLLEEVVMDVTFALGHIRQEEARRQAEKLLRDSEERLLFAQQMAHVGYWERNFVTGQVTWSDETYRMYGLVPRTPLDDLSLIQKRVHPEDLPGMLAAIQAAQEGLQPYDHEYRVVHPDGTVRVIHSRGEVTRDANGNLLRMLGTSMDITERKQAEEKIRTALNEKDILLRELYHRTKNNMQVINAMLVLQTLSSPNPEVQQLVQETTNKIQSMALVHQMLYQSQDLSNINLQHYIRELAELILSSYGPIAGQVALEMDLEPVFVTIDTATPLGLILNELLSNACKYAFPDGREGKIRIRLSRQAQDLIQLEFSDNGVGVPAGFDLRSRGTYGLWSMFGLAEEQMNGQVQVDTRQGIGYTIQFPDRLYQTRV